MMLRQKNTWFGSCQWLPLLLWQQPGLSRDSHPKLESVTTMTSSVSNIFLLKCTGMILLWNSVKVWFYTWKSVKKVCAMSYLEKSEEQIIDMDICSSDLWFLPYLYSTSIVYLTLCQCQNCILLKSGWYICHNINLSRIGHVTYRKIQYFQRGKPSMFICQLSVLKVWSCYKKVSCCGNLNII